MIHRFVDREIIPPIRHDSSFLRHTIHPSTYNSSVPLGLDHVVSTNDRRVIPCAFT